MAYLLQHLLEETAQKYPDKKAVQDKNRSMTYSELDKASGRLAAVLLANGVEKGDRVAFWLKKSLEAVVCMFGILKAGAVYVPVDPFAPAKRVKLILKNCGVKALVASGIKLRKTGKDLIKLQSVRLFVDTDQDKAENLQTRKLNYLKWQDIEKFDAPGHTNSEGVDRDLAYILYTSGSTGVPKGVMISHINALTFINWSYQKFRVRSEDELANHAPLHFDLPVFDIYAGIKAGATVHLLSHELSIFPKSLSRYVNDQKLTIWYSVPSILVHMITRGSLDGLQFPNLRLVLFAGEAFPVKYLRELMARIPHAGFYNLYGPVETNVCTFHRIKEIQPEKSRPVPIGKQCENYEVFLLDENGKVVTKPEKVGELCVRGSGVALGYWRDKKKTDSGFQKDILSSGYADRMYRTGDLGKFDFVGDYHLAGRKDHMIKSRGYRIELGEIESALYSHQEIEEAVAVAIPDKEITNRITSFVVLNRKSEITEMDLKKYLSERISEYMVPESINIVQSIPKTSTGKMDRSALAHQSRQRARPLGLIR
jgi:amino acid adenylation domain-containing protein